MSRGRGDCLEVILSHGVDINLTDGAGEKGSLISPSVSVLIPDADISNRMHRASVQKQCYTHKCDCMYAKKMTRQGPIAVFSLSSGSVPVFSHFTCGSRKKSFTFTDRGME